MGMIELTGGGYATNVEAVTALELEARRRGISYGRLAANTDKWEQEQIIRAYCAGKQEKRAMRKEIKRKGRGDK